MIMKKLKENGGVSIELCGSNKETAAIDITEEEFLVILSPEGINSASQSRVR